MPRKDLDHVPGGERDVQEEADLARKVFLFGNLPIVVLHDVDGGGELHLIVLAASIRW